MANLAAGIQQLFRGPDRGAEARADAARQRQEAIALKQSEIADQRDAEASRATIGLRRTPRGRALVSSGLPEKATLG